MVLGKRWLFSIGNGAEIRPLEKGRKPLSFDDFYVATHFQSFSSCSQFNFKDKIINCAELFKIISSFFPLNFLIVGKFGKAG